MKERQLMKVGLGRWALLVSILFNVGVIVRWTAHRFWTSSGNHYFDHRMSLLRSLQVPEHAIVFIGDSLTDQGEWAELLGMPNVVNRGINGAGVRDAIDLVTSLDLRRVDAVVALVGINDLAAGVPPDRLAKNFEELIVALKQQIPASRILIQSILAVNRTRNGALPSSTRIVSMNTILKELANNAGCTFVESNRALADEQGSLKEQLSLDGVHLNAEGYALLVNNLRPHVLRIVR